MTKPQTDPVAIIGAGMAGLSCARSLAQAGHAVTVLEKSRGPGGRAATRRSDAGGFDHGAQYATARGDRFHALIAALAAEGIVAPWGGGANDRWVGVPGMNALVRGLLAELPADAVTVETQIRVTGLHRTDGAWQIEAEGDLWRGPFSAVVVTAPAPQTAELLAPWSALAVEVSGCRLDPCLTAMVGFAAPVADMADSAEPADGVLAWAARDSAKPGRAAGERWVLQATPDWSRSHLELPPESFAPKLLAAFAALAGPLPEASHLAGHRWRYSRVDVPLGQPCLWDPALRLGAAGDWCLGPRLEAAFDSGTAVAEAVLTTG